MENNKQTSDTESAIEAMTLQDTIHMEPEEQNEVERSLTELQWQQQFDDQVTGTETESQLQKDSEQEGQEIRTRLQQRWQEPKQGTVEAEQQIDELKKMTDNTHPPRL